MVNINNIIIILYNNLINLKFSLLSHSIYEILSIILYIAIAIKANEIFSKNQNPKMAILAGAGFIVALFEIFHITYSDLIKYYNLEFVYLIIANIIFAIALFSCVLYSLNNLNRTDSKFRMKVYIAFVSIFLIITGIIEYIKIIHSTLFYNFTNEFIINNPFFETIDNVIIILALFLFLHLKQIKGEKLLTPFTLGLIWFGFGQLYAFTPEYLSSYHRHFVHIGKITGLTLLYLGLKEVQYNYEIYLLRQRIILSPVILLILFNFVLSTYFLIIYDIKIPLHIQYAFVIFIIFTLYASIKVTNSIANPISKIMNGIEANKPGKKPYMIPVITNDEVGLIAEKFNEYSELNWQISQKILKEYTKTKLFKNIIEAIRSPLDINKLKQTVVREIGKTLEADSCVILQIDPKTNKFLVVDEFSEYMTLAANISHVGIDLETEEFKQYKIQLQSESKEIIIPDMNNPPECYSKDIVTLMIEKFGIKSNYTLPIIHKNETIGYLYINYIREKKIFTEEELDFFRALANETGIALSHSIMYNDAVKAVEREHVIRKVIETSRSSLDINVVKQNIVNEIGKLLNADRCNIFEYDAKNNVFITPDEYSEYLSSPEVPKLKLIEEKYEQATDFFYNKFRKKEEFNWKCIQDFIKENNLKDTIIEAFLYDSNIQASINLPMFYRDILVGYLTVDFEHPHSLEDLDYSRILANQTGVAIYQAKLYEKEKQTAEKERLLREITNIIKDTFDKQEIKSKLTEKIGDLLKPDRVFIIEFDYKNKCYIPVDSESEYLSSPELLSFVDVDLTAIMGFEYIQNRHLQCKDVIYSEFDNFLLQENLSGTETEDFLRMYNIESLLALSICYEGELLGNLVIQYSTKKEFDDEFISFTKNIAGLVATGLHQSELYIKVKQKAETEESIRRLIELMMSSHNLKEIQNKIVNELARYMKADRCIFRIFDEHINDFLPIDDNAEYRASENIPSYIGITLPTQIKKIFIEEANTVKYYCYDLIQDFIEKYQLQNTDSEDFIIKQRLKSLATIYLSYGGKMIGSISLQYFENQHSFTEDELNFLDLFTSQASIAMYQNKLYDTEKAIASREVLLRGIVSNISSSLEINEIKEKLTESIGAFFNLDRCFIIEYSQDQDSLLNADYCEYRSSDDIRSISEFDFSLKEYDLFKNLGKNRNEIFVTDIKLFIEHNKEEINQSIINYFNELNIKSGFEIPIFYGEVYLGIIAGHYSKTRSEYSSEDKEFITTIAKQAGIAMYQAKLFNKIKKQAEIEKISRKIVEEVRITLDIHKVKESIVNEVGIAFDADRCYFRKFDKNINEFLPPDVEYLRSPEVSSLLEVKVNQAGLRFFVDEAERQKNYTPLIVNQELIERKNFRDTPLEEYFNQCGIKTDIAIPMWDKKDELYFLVLHYKENITFMPEEMLKLAETIANQSLIAINQSQLFAETKQTAEKERLLREIISQIRVSNDLNQVYKYLNSKIAEVFNVSRVLFFETSAQEYQEPTLKHEVITDKSLMVIDNNKIPKEFINTLEETSENATPFIVNNTNSLYPDSKEVVDFLEEYNIKSLFIMPMIRYNGNVKIFGILVLCDSQPRIWRDHEINLIKSILESTVSIVWEITKIIEINNLRDTFIETLAHDLQVPLVGEEKAMEFILNRPNNEKIAASKEIITMLADNNKNLILLLKKLLSSYYYDAGRKILELNDCKISDIIYEVIDSFKEILKSKSITINVDIQENLHSVNVEKEEIKTVIKSIIENAILYTQANGNIQINSYTKDEELITCITDNGPGISPDIEKIIFKRYEMSKAIERKVGAGLSLYLARQIVEAHKGRIFYTTKLGQGTTFCFSLPI